MAERARHTVRVRYGEVDQQGVVFNAHYLAYCDDATDQWFREHGLLSDGSDWDIMLKRAVIEWQGPATNGDDLDIDFGVDRLGTTSFDIGFVGNVASRPVFTATITYVGVDATTHTPTPPPPEVRDKLAPAPS